MMTPLILLFAALASFASCQDLTGQDKDLLDNWAKFKAIESCYGEDYMRTYLLKMKRAIAKCTKTEMPELDLPMYDSSPFRAVQALLNGAKEIEQKNEESFQIVLKSILGPSALSSSSSSPKTAYAPSPYMYYQQPYQYGALDELMRNFFIKKVMKELAPTEEARNSAKAELEGSEERFPEDILAGEVQESSSRTRRQSEDGEAAGDLFLERVVRQSDLYELGDRLSEKLTIVRQDLAYDLSNYSCILQEIHTIDGNLELDLGMMINEVKNMKIRNIWLEDKTITDIRTCYAYAQALPVQLFDEQELPAEWVKIKYFERCRKTAKFQTCMNYDIKKKLEENFGSLPKLVETTGLPEKQLLPMAMKLLHGDLDDLV